MLSGVPQRTNKTGLGAIGNVITLSGYLGKWWCVLIRISPQTVYKEDVSMQYGGRQWSRPYCMEELTLQTTHLAQIYCDLLYMDLSHYISYLP